MISKTQGWRLIRRVLPNVLALGIVFLFGGVLIEIVGESAFEIYRILWNSTFGSFDDFGYVLFNATRLIFTGLAVTIGFKGGLFNIGCEGQLYVAAFVAAWMGCHFNLSAVLLIPLCLFSAMVAGKGALDIEILTSVPRELFLIIQAFLILLLICTRRFSRETA
ncbi:ABC transporter permease [Candidatus Poribacteria bacterium]|nr:ABC transporter permease [Candidatus Poribacteria bacterium]